MTETGELIFVILMAISLSACTGLRAFLPPLAVSLLAMGNYITLAPNFEWLGRWEVAAVFGVAALLEIIADKFPGIDNMLDAAGLVVKPLAGALLASSLITQMDPVLAMVLGIIVGGTVAGGVHVGKAKLRLASTSFTGGLANQAVSWLEDMFTVIGTALGVLFPWIVVLAVIIGFYFLFKLVFAHRRRGEAGMES